MVIGACLWIPRNLWNKLGGFPEWFESIAEDMQICCRARLAGFPVEVTLTSSYRHRQGNSFGGNRLSDGRLRTTYQRRRLSERNKTFVLALCTPRPSIWILLPFHILALATEGVFLAIAKREYSIFTKIYKSALTAFFYKIPSIRHERRLIQASIQLSTKQYFSVFTRYPQKLKLLSKYGIPQVQ